MCENRLEEVQGAATSSLFRPPLFQDTWPCVQLLCAERNAPCQRDLATDKTKPFTYRLRGKHGPGKPKMIWKQLTERGIAESGSSWLSTLMIEICGDLSMRSAMRAASQLSGRGPTDVDVAPVPAC